MKRILRVFVERTANTPRDSLVQIGEPDLFTPKDVDEVHVSCLFSWHADRAMKLWSVYQNCGAYRHAKVEIGGPAIKGNYSDEFTPGLYVKEGITTTTRGCNYNCPWCAVRDMEGNFREIPITEGNEIQDNNILLSSWSHWDKVIAMLKTQKAIRFVGGLDSRLLTSRHIEDMRSLRIKEMWFSYDEPGRWPSLLRAGRLLKEAGFPYHKLRCYVLVKFDPEERVEDAEKRLQDCYQMGFMPFVQIYRSPDAQVRGSTHLPEGEYRGSWNELREIWSRPARIKQHMKGVTTTRGE